MILEAVEIELERLHGIDKVLGMIINRFDRNRKYAWIWLLNGLSRWALEGRERSFGSLSFTVIKTDWTGLLHGCFFNILFEAFLDD